MAYLIPNKVLNNEIFSKGHKVRNELTVGRSCDDNSFLDTYSLLLHGRSTVLNCAV